MEMLYKSRYIFGVAVALLALVALVPLALAQGTVTVEVTQNDTLGQFLADADGMTLYMFTRDEPNKSNCYDNCATAWPPLLVADGSQPSAGAGVTGSLGVIDRTDGTQQVTYNDMPLYYYVSDSAAGDTSGQFVGDVWFVVHPAAPSVTVSDQSLQNDTVTIDRVVTDEPGWLVLHADNGGAPGAVVGHSAVEPGENLNVELQVDAAQATPTLYAMLHVDRGTLGTYEFPGADTPVRLGGNVVTPPFQVSNVGEVAAAESEPQTLPQSGGGPALWLVAMVVLGVLAVAGGLTLTVARRAH